MRKPCECELRIDKIYLTQILVVCTREERATMGIPEGVIRYSVGIEDTEDLIADLDQARRIGGHIQANRKFTSPDSFGCLPPAPCLPAALPLYFHLNPKSLYITTSSQGEPTMSNQSPDLRPKNIAQAIEGMALSFNPEKAGDLQATIQFHVSGQDGGDWNLTIADGQCRCEIGVVANPALTINTPADVWLAIARKERSGAMAMVTGKYKSSGKMSLLLKMDKIFSRQATEMDLAAKGWL
ncbi:MAG: hypothetical protein GY759_02510 [Chloroflexi bacterium]|nr:hypothetical protein [Chloroflexota bacterium]